MTELSKKSVYCMIIDKNRKTVWYWKRQLAGLVWDGFGRPKNTKIRLFTRIDEVKKANKEYKEKGYRIQRS